MVWAFGGDLVLWVYVVFIAGLLGLWGGLGRCAVWSWNEEIVVFCGCRM